MSEYQYYAFAALDRPLDEAARRALRAMSTRARITATGFVNTYEWGDFKGDPLLLMERWFDLHLYWANWGSRRVMFRFPEQAFDASELRRFLAKSEGVTVRNSGASVILDINSEDEDQDEEEWHEGPAWLGMAGVRADLARGDPGPLYVLWLQALQDGVLDDDDREPLPGIGPLTASLHTLAAFIRLDPDLLQAAAESADGIAAPPRQSVGTAIASLSDRDRTALLVGVLDGDAGAAASLRRKVRDAIRAQRPAPPASGRTVEALRRRRDAIRDERLHLEAQAETARRRRRTEQEARARERRVLALAGRGEEAWREVETEIERRNGPGYANAAALLSDLKILAVRNGRSDAFQARLAGIRAHHARRHGLLRRLADSGL